MISLTSVYNKLCQVWDALSSLYTLGMKLKTTVESLMSKLALSGVSLSALTGAGFFTLLYAGVDKLFAALNNLDHQIDAMNSGSASGSWLAKLNHYFPIDTLATVVLLFLAIWTALATFKFWAKIIGMVVGFKQGHSKTS